MSNMSLEKKFIKENLGKTFCYKCGSSLERAKLVPISEAPIALVAHVSCPKCQAESMVTITANGVGSIPLTSDLMPDEFKKFLGTKSISLNDLLDLHKLLKKDSLWSLLRKQEQVSVKKLKVSKKI